MTMNHDTHPGRKLNGLDSNPIVNGHRNGLSNGHVSVSVPNGIGHHEDGNIREARPLAPFMPVAICGMACRLPGGVHSPLDLWDILLAKGDARGLVPETRYSIAGYHSRNKQPGTTVTQHGYFLDESVDLAGLDTSFFSMSRSEVERLDPQVRILLEVARESLDDAGEVGWKGKDVGVYVGSYGNDWYDLFHTERQQYGLYQISTTQDYSLSNRLSYEMDLHGPSVTIRTACSSGLVGLNEACAAIAKGDCSSAIVGGTSIIMAPTLTSAMSEQGALSPDGSCKTFSAEANGYARGEAVVAVYIKPLVDAIRDGSPIQAVIRGTATNDDGKTPGFSVPSSEAQEALIRHTYKVAGIADSDVGRTGFFECHGTGTPVGDPIETNAVARVFGSSGGITIGSLKPNLGHTEGASGLVSLLKAVLMLQKKTILPNIKALPLNPKIPFQNAGLTVPLEAIPWPEERHERISINSFGIGGSNAHCIVESAVNFYPSKSTRSHTAAPLAPQLLLFSANHPHSLKQLVDNYGAFLEKTADSLALDDVAYTLAHRREHLPIRSFSVGTRDKPGAATAARTAPTTGPFSLVMVFTGQGAQWPQMGRELLRHNPIFSATIRSLDSHLQSLNASWKIEEELMKPARKSRIHEAELSQPLCTALQIALVDVLISLGIQPVAVVGHSSGEIAAAYAAGGISARDALTVAFHRGRTAQMAPAGSMAAVGLGHDEVSRFLKPGVIVACDNSPSNVTLSGHTQKLEQVLAAIREAHKDGEVQITKLKVERAYHSQYMAIVGGKYVHAMNNAGIRVTRPSVPFFSSVTGKLMATIRSKNEAVTPFSPEYWQKNLESPVLFRDAVSSIIQDSEPTRRNLLFLEVGPHRALAGPLRQILTNAGRSLNYYSLLSRSQNSMESFLTTVGELWASHMPIDFGALIPPGSCVPNLPLYPWNHQSTYWYESRISREWRMRSQPYHDLLGIRVPESSDIEPMWRNLLHLNSVPWIRDHKIEDSTIFPLACYVAMAAEAVRQLSGIQQGVEMRRVTVTTALVLNDMDGTPTELITSLKRQRIRDALDSSWWQFSVVSHNSHTWTKHCSGEVRATTSTSWGDGARSTPADDKVPRKVDMRKWYERVRRGGIQYGPHFISIDSMRTSAGTSGLGRGKGQLRNNWHGDEENYHLHPIILDTYFQVQSSVAQFARSHAYTQFIPVSIASLAFSRSPADHLTLESSAELVGDSCVGSGSCTDGSQVILKASGVRMAPLESREESAGSGDSVSLTSRQEWVPHIDSLPFDTVCKPSKIQSSYAPAVDLLAQLSISHAQKLIRQLEPSVTTHMEKYKGWICQQQQEQPNNMILGLVEIDEETLTSQIDSLAAMLASSPLATVAAAIQKISNNIKDMCSGEKEALEVLISGDTLGKLDVFLRDYDASDFLSHLAHSKPNLRILELDAGLGDSTARNLQALRRQDGTVLYSQYNCTDRQPAIIRKAQEKLSLVPNMEFHTFNIDEDPAQQELDGGQFDLVIAAGVLHKSSDLRRTLEHVRTLLAPEGRLLLQQPRPGISWIKFVLGTLPEWWSHDRDDGSHLSEEQWKTALVQSGFQKPGKSDVVHDQLTTRIVARPQKEETGRSRQVVLLYNAPPSASTISVIQQLESKGFDILHGTMDQVLPRGRDIISLLDYEVPFFDTMDEDAWLRFRSFTEHLRDGAHGMFWITKLSHTCCANPTYGMVFGLARTIRSELGIDFAVCETDESCNKAVLDSFTRFHERSDAGDLGTDFEYAISNGVPRVNRFFPFSLEDDLIAPEPHSQAVLAISKPGRLGTLHWKSMFASAPREEEVDVEIYASGLNFRDVLVAMGIIGVSARELAFGYEAAGIIRRRGPNATKFEVGDRVLLSGIETCASNVICSQSLCVKMADSLSFAEAASLPIVFMTAVYCLIDVGRVEKGSSLLIHSGASGVGLAAIQIAHMLEAEVFTTVSSEAQADYLVKSHGIQRNRIFHSRDDSFVQALLTETNGRGVDLALNSLSGELLHATWRNCIASWGTMIEIGKRDLIGSGHLDMDVFLANRSYCCVDIDQMREDRPELVERLLQRVMMYYQEGNIKPIRVDKVANAVEAAETFQHMQQRSHMGKVVMKIRDEDTGELTITDKISPARRSVELSPEASYLLVGGLGGLGRTVAVWMAENGAKHLTFLSRRAGQGPHDEDLRAELEDMGCSVQFERGSVESLEDVKRVIQGSPKPVRGILQMTMVLRNAAFGSMTFEDWQVSVGPKVKGAWNLHTAVEELGITSELEFFVLFSSLSGVTGQPGQANYAAANSFLDAFAKFRTQRGLTCSVVDIGAMEGVGYLLEHDQMLRKLKGTGWNPVKEEELLEAVGAAMLPRVFSSNPAGIAKHAAIRDNSGMLLGIAPATPLGNLESSSRLRRDVRMAIFHNFDKSTSGQADSTGNETLKEFLDSTKDNPSILREPETAKFFASVIGKRLFSLLLKPEQEPNITSSLEDIGLDSMIAIEMRSWWKQAFGLNIGVLEMLGTGSLEALGERVAKELAEISGA